MSNEQNYISIAKNVLQSEIDGIADLARSLDQSFIDLVNLILKTKGKVIVSGMGKSGHIARKIAATLSSTGTPSFFVHPAEASHGDLGMIDKNDIVILLSNSGETNELKDIIHYTRRFSIFLVAFVRKSNSSLAQASDLTINFPNNPEALEFDAPTTSTTMMLAFGDALALTILEAKGFSRKDFQIFHPGGRLGASFVKVSDLMHKGEALPYAQIDQSMDDVISIITKKGLGCIAILNKQQQLAGIITDGDLRRNLQRDILLLKAIDIMTKNPITILPNVLAIEALDFMNNKKVTNLFVVDEYKKLLGVLHIHDCLRVGASPML